MSVHLAQRKRRWKETKRAWGTYPLVPLRNRRQWISISGSKYRRPTQRDDDELVVRELPELAIVTREVWDASVARRGQLRKGSRGRHPTAHLFSGLLRCGMCGGGMSVMSTTVKNGKRYVAYGCNVSRTRGNAICRNRVLVSELQLLGFVREALKDLPTRPEFQESFLEAFEATVVAHTATQPPSGLGEALKAQEARVARLVDAKKLRIRLPAAPSSNYSRRCREVLVPGDLLDGLRFAPCVARWRPPRP